MEALPKGWEIRKLPITQADAVFDDKGRFRYTVQDGPSRDNVMLDMRVSDEATRPPDPAYAKALIARLTDGQRVELFLDYCSGCGAPVPPICHCQNDE